MTMIHEVSGDLVLSSAAAIAHGVAPNDHFNSGLALQLRERFPAMFKDFRHYGQTAHPKPGDLWTWSGVGPEGPVHIVSLFTQDGGFEHGAKPGRAHVDSVNHCLKKLHKWVEEQKPASLALPRLATGVGGLKWEDVSPLIRQHLGAVKIPVVVYTGFKAGVKASEPIPKTTAAAH
jgi:O-acetyl-ADP-ribose deacetylase (regulator of RNase III)